MVYIKTFPMQNLSKKGLLLASFLLFSCHDSKKFSFSSPEEAIGCCRDFLGDIKEKDMSDIRTLAEVSNKWIELRDSSIVCMERDSSFILNEDIVTSFIGLTDSIKTEITNAAVSKNRTIEELYNFKRLTVSKEKRIDERTYDDAIAFFKSLDKYTVYKDISKAVKLYKELFATTVNNLKKEGDLLNFITKEDVLFRSLMANLDKVSQEDLADLTKKTSAMVFDVYKGLGDDEVSRRVQSYLTMRFNRRIIQNAEACHDLLAENHKLSDGQLQNFRWMLIQPFITIDDEGFSLLTEEQLDLLQELAKSLPGDLSRADRMSGTNSQENEKLLKELPMYFFKFYLKSIL